MENKPQNILWILIFLFGLSSCINTHDEDPNLDLDSSPKTTASITSTPFLPLKTTAEISEPDPLDLRTDGFHELFRNIAESDPVFFNPFNPSCQLKKTDREHTNVELVVALAARFDTLVDSIDSEELRNYFLTGKPILGVYDQIITSQVIAETMVRYLSLDPSRLIVVNQEDMRDALYTRTNSLILIPFDQLIPAYKVMRIDQQSPFDQNFDTDNYFLTFNFALVCESPNVGLTTIWSNRQANKLTSVLLTGTTALTRAIAYKMEINGNQYPGEKVKPWFDAADISHISNEVSYFEGCPSADPNQDDLFFCGRTEYIELFTYLGVDVIELSGNHLVDKGVQPLVSMMESFDALNFPYYAAGMDSEAAMQPVYFEVNGNRIAFLGCNAAGPSFVYATESRAGVNQCDMDDMSQMVTRVVEEGYLPIVTFQYWETYQFDPMPWQQADSQRMISSGAVIVSGSQAHLPMTMEVFGDGFIHYGLGNMFFDQMDIPVTGTRREFADRHIFYNGKYLGVELLTAMLEDYSQPRPMTAEERQKLLMDAFVDFSQN